MPEPEHIDRRRAALIAYDVCRRALTPSDPARRAAIRPVIDAWVQMIAAARGAGVPVIYTTPVSRSDGADVVMLPTDLSAETGVPPLTNAVEGTAEAGFPDEIAPRRAGPSEPERYFPPPVDPAHPAASLQSMSYTIGMFAQCPVLVVK